MRNKNRFFIVNKQEYNQFMEIIILSPSFLIGIKNMFLTEHGLYPKTNPTCLSSNSVNTT
jgi:hypothetical protein